MDATLTQYEDHQWLIDAERLAGAKLLVHGEVLCERRMAPGEGFSESGNFPYFQSWFLRNEGQFSKKARSDIISGQLSRTAAYDHRYSELFWLVPRFMLNFEFRNLLTFVKPWIFRKGLKSLLRSILSKLRLTKLRF